MLINYLRTDGLTDRHVPFREITLNRSCNVFKFNPSNECEKRRPNRIETLIAIPSSTIAYSRLNGKYNICIFTHEIQVFES